MANECLQLFIDCLLNWNLKYDHFPEVIQDGHTVLIGFERSTEEIKFSSESEARAGFHRLCNAMEERSKRYWNVPSYY